MGWQIPSLHSLQSPAELLVVLLWMTLGICIHWLIYHIFQYPQSTGLRIIYSDRVRCYNTSDNGSGEWYLVRRDYMLWRNSSIYPRLAWHGSYTCSSRPRMVSGFSVSEGWFYSAHVGWDWGQLNCCASLHFRQLEKPPILLRKHIKHLLYEQR